MESIEPEVGIVQANLSIFSRKTEQKCLKAGVEPQVVNARVK
jgi:hypothetical protein